jgi:hypothetical protein
MFSAITNVRTGKIMPVEFCLECDCNKSVEGVQDEEQE